MKTLFLGIAAAISLTIGAIAPAHAINISSATRSLATALPVHTAQFSKRAKPSHQLFCLQLGNDCRTGGDFVLDTRQRTIVKRCPSGYSFAALAEMRSFD